jgi:diaminohydroxyphosphoribosylaminopyrimidine deaminase/5-amino-6-(5-phosphoribosylamino)uracil reductase
VDERAAMERALALAWHGWGRVGANPMVGAVVLRDGAVVAEGWHAEFGGPHGEAAALAVAGERARGATLVVTLEPCRHHGKTPPCVDAIVRSGLARVVYGASDVDPDARGGAAVLERAGVSVEGGLYAEQVRSQNAAFFHRYEAPQRPFVALKLAMSLDGHIADHARHSRWVSGESARGWVHWLRAGYDAIAVGVGTARADDPELTVRGDVRPARTPLRVVFDRRAELPMTSKLVRSAAASPVLVIAGSAAPERRISGLVHAGLDVAVGDDWGAALAALASRGVGSVLVEGGSVVAGHLLAEELVDRLYVTVAPLMLGSGGVPAFAGMPDTPIGEAKRWRLVGRRALGDDTLLVLDRP